MIKLCCKLFLCFALFSFLGWVMETLLYIIRDGKVVKRGFLFGPVCPIYGVGTLIATFLLKSGMTNAVWIFYFGLVLCGLLEYITHFVMEKAFKAMWWDYSDRFLNVKGRVYFKGLLIFGAGMLLLVKFVLPPFYYLLDIIPVWVLFIISFVIYTIIIIDITTTVADLMDTVKLLKKAINHTIVKGQEGFDDLSDVIDSIMDKSEEKVAGTKEKLKEISAIQTIVRTIRREHRILYRIKNKYPNFDLKKYKEELEWYFAPEKDTKGKDGIKLHGTGEIDMDEEAPEENIQ